MNAKILSGATVILCSMSMEESNIFSSDGEIREIAFTDTKIDC